MAPVISTSHGYAERGKLNLFEKHRTLTPHTLNRFTLETEGLFGRIKTSDTRDGWESEVLRNIDHNQENALDGAHKVAEGLFAGDYSAATEAFSVFDQLIQASWNPVTERVDLFAEAFESGKSEANIIQKYLREDD